MTEDNYRELTERHDHALERLSAYEGAQKGHRRWMITAVLTALGAGGGSGVLAYTDSSGDDNMETVVATHVATSNQRAKVVDGDIGDLQDQQMKLREAVIRLQVTVEGISGKVRGNADIRAGLREVGDLLEDMHHGKRRSRKGGRPAPESVQELRGQLFAE